MTLEELIETVGLKGLRLNNLFQLNTGRWQANVTDGERYWEFGRGDSATEALQAALVKHSTTEPEMGRKDTISVHNPPRRPRVSDEQAAEELRGLI